MTPLAEIALLFLKLGATAFGGPAAHIALMEEEVVRRRKWLTENQFLDLLGATNMIPGPNSTELAIHIGFARAGWRGLLTAGVCFILPATLIVLAIAAAYVTYGTLPAAQAFLYGVKPVVIVVILQALWNLLRKAVKSVLLAVIGVACVALLFAGVHELVVLFGSGALVVVLSGAAARWTHSRTMCLFTAGCPILPMLAVTVPASGNLLVVLFLSFLKIGSVLFGSGYVLLAFLRSEFVVRLGWLTEAELLDATAVGQITPGPVFTTATFIGYLIDGPAGGVVATVGIFLPAFVFVALSAPLVPRLRRSAVAGRFLDGVNVASLALMVWVSWELGRASIVDWPTALIAVVSALLLAVFRINSAWLILSAGAVTAANG